MDGTLAIREDLILMQEILPVTPLRGEKTYKKTTATIMYTHQETANARGMVITHACIIWRGTSHLTAFTPRVAPTPTIAPLITWVDETGIPNMVTIARIAPPEVAAQNPW